MITVDPPVVVYHVAAMGNWQEVVVEQMRTLSRAGLFDVRLTHVGQHVDWLMSEALRWGLRATLARSDPNTLHYETFGMWEAERIAREEGDDRAILYMHTKGVSAPHSQAKRHWRRMMDGHVVAKWRENVAALENHDAVGVNWYPCEHDHFAGNYWVARPDWIRKLPDFGQFHNEHHRVRFTCEWWIGAAAGMRAKSLVTSREYWAEDKEEFYKHRIPIETREPSITWVSAVTRGYEKDLVRLQSSFGLLGRGHKLESVRLDGEVHWRHTNKFNLLRRAIRMAETTHVFWIDADCEFVVPVEAADLTRGKRLTAVRHFGSDHPRCFLPPDLAARIRWPVPSYSWQACLFGGEVGPLADQLSRLDWMEHEGRDYDEHGLVMDWSRHDADLLTLPCRYAAPTSFGPFPEYEGRYRDRAEGSPIILHHNRALCRP